MPRQQSTHVDDARAVGMRLRDARLRAGLTQRDLAFPGCSAAYVSRIEAGARVPSLQVLRELGRRLGVSAEFLAGAGDAAAARLVDAQIALRLDELDEARRLFEAALKDASVPSARIDALEGLGLVAFRDGRLQDAVELLEQALTESGRDGSALPSLAQALAEAYLALGELAAAIDLLGECADFFAELGDPVQYVRFASLLGRALIDDGDTDAAGSFLGNVLARGREIAEPYTRARLYRSQSARLAAKGRGDLADQYAQKALETLRAADDARAVADAFESLAHVELELRRPANALELLEEGAPWVRQAGAPLALVRFRIEEARALAALGEAAQAVAIAGEVADELRGDRQTLAHARVSLLLGELFEDLDESVRAQECYENAIALLERSAPNRYLVRAYKRLAGVLKAAGEPDVAIELLERALAIQERGVAAA